MRRSNDIRSKRYYQYYLSYLSDLFNLFNLFNLYYLYNLLHLLNQLYLLYLYHLYYFYYYYFCIKELSFYLSSGGNLNFNKVIHLYLRKYKIILCELYFVLCERKPDFVSFVWNNCVLFLDYINLCDHCTYQLSVKIVFISLYYFGVSIHRI